MFTSHASRTSSCIHVSLQLVLIQASTFPHEPSFFIFKKRCQTGNILQEVQAGNPASPRGSPEAAAEVRVSRRVNKMMRLIERKESTTERGKAISRGCVQIDEWQRITDLSLFPP